MTQKLYYEDQYIKEFTAEIIHILEIDNEFHIQLDRTAFFPGGGGQPSDTGSIEDSIILYVYEKDGIIYHVTNKKPIKIHRAKCKINWDFRFDGMQQHLGQHILSSAFLELFNVNTISFQIEKDFCTIDVDKFLGNEEIEKIEAHANYHIFANKNVKILFPSKSELKKLSLRKVPVSKDEVSRVVNIEDIDTAICSGLHPKSTLEVQIIKIRKKEKIKGNMHVEFVCGRRAVFDSFRQYSFSSKICKFLNCSEGEALLKIENLTTDLKELSVENKNYKLQIADFQVENILRNCETFGDIRVIKSIFANSDSRDVNLLASKLTSHEKVIVLYALKSDNMATLMFMCSKNLNTVSMNELLKDAVSLVDGKGGGSSFSAQGGGKGVNNLESALDYAFTKVKKIISSK